MSTATRMTADEYYTISVEGDRKQLVDGQIVVTEPKTIHELWLVDDAADTVLVYRRSKPGARTFDVALELVPGDVLDSPGLPGFALPLDELFRR
jgi:hypothetical protein